METRATWQPWQEMRRLQREMEHLFGDQTIRVPKAAARPGRVTWPR
jgi:hypothetical protein